MDGNYSMLDTLDMLPTITHDYRRQAEILPHPIVREYASTPITTTVGVVTRGKPTLLD